MALPRKWGARAYVHTKHCLGDDPEHEADLILVHLDPRPYIHLTKD